MILALDPGPVRSALVVLDGTAVVGAWLESNDAIRARLIEWSVVYRAQADALDIEAQAKRRLADEYDAAQERGEVATDGRPVKSVPNENGKATAADLGLTRKDIHEARIVRDAVLVVEQIQSFGMPAGAELFETCWWSGRFAECWPGPTARLPRRDVKLHLCGTSRAKDGNVRQALLDRYGGKDAAIGKKATPGPLYGLRADLWAALAVGVTYHDTHAQEAA